MKKQMKILISADDGEWGRDSIDKLIQKGVDVELVKRNGTLLLERIREKQPDMVLMELYMPGIDGIGVINTAKTMKIDMPMFIVTASFATPVLEREILNTGAAYFALSPFDKDEMIQRMLTLYSAKGQ